MAIDQWKLKRTLWVGELLTYSPIFLMLHYGLKNIYPCKYLVVFRFVSVVHLYRVYFLVQLSLLTIWFVFWSVALYRS